MEKWDRDDLDPEVRPLVEAMNRFSGITTIESCCGHGKEPFRIWFVADDLEDLPPLLWSLDGCHCGVYGWSVMARTDCTADGVRFYVQSPGRGAKAYGEADHIARSINKDADRQAHPVKQGIINRREWRAASQGDDVRASWYAADHLRRMGAWAQQKVVVEQKPLHFGD